jgi:UDP-glucose 4-epimerase
VRVLDIADPRHSIAGVEYRKGDVRQSNDILEAVSGVDAVYHLAAVVSVPACQEDPEGSYQTNVVATGKLLQVVSREMKTKGKKIRFVFSGSCAVYGDAGKDASPRVEGSSPVGPRSSYATQKLASEQLITEFHKSEGIPAVIFRCFNVYGPGQEAGSPYSGVISVFTAALKKAQPLRLNGGGVATRDFVSVHDVVRAFAHVMELSEGVCDARPINLASGRSISIRELAQEMMKISGKNVLLEDAPAREGDILYSVSDIRRAGEILGWKPDVDLLKGLGELLK